jgi:monoamine oxidase
VALDNLSIADWITSRVPGGRDAPLGKLLEAAYIQELGDDIEEVSALELVYILGSLEEPDEFAVFGESDERFHIRGGNQRLPLAVADALSADAIQRGWRLSAIAQGTAGTMDLTFATVQGDALVNADQVILALPFAVLRAIDYRRAGFDALKDQAIQELGRGRSAKLMVQYTNRYWNQRGPWGISTGSSYTDQSYESSWEVTRGQAGESGILSGFSGGSRTLQFTADMPHTTAQNEATARAAREFGDDIEAVFPGLAAFANGKAALSLPQLDPNLGLSYSYYRVGQMHAFGGYEAIPQGSVYFAGEHTSEDFAGYMEGGAESGVRAAREVLVALRGRRA